MSVVRYLLAKHIPDIHRREPRNVGVILWLPGGHVLAKFAGESVKKPGTVTVSQIPDFIQDPDAYKQWISYWRALLEQSAIPSTTSEAHVSKRSQRYVEALAEKSKPTYYLEPSGMLMTEVSENDAPATLEHLYLALVAPQGQPGARTSEAEPSELLRKQCTLAIRAAGLGQNPYFQYDFGVTVRFKELADRLFFDYALLDQENQLRRLYQRVPLARRQKELAKNVDSSAFRCEKVVASGMVDYNDCIALIAASPADLQDPDVERGIRVLQTAARVVNVYDTNIAIQEFSPAKILEA